MATNAHGFVVARTAANTLSGRQIFGGNDVFRLPRDGLLTRPSNQLGHAI